MYSNIFPQRRFLKTDFFTAACRIDSASSASAWRHHAGRSGQQHGGREETSPKGDREPSAPQPTCCHPYTPHRRRRNNTSDGQAFDNWVFLSKTRSEKARNQNTYGQTLFRNAEHTTDPVVHQHTTNNHPKPNCICVVAGSFKHKRTRSKVEFLLTSVLISPSITLRIN